MKFRHGFGIPFPEFLVQLIQIEKKNFACDNELLQSAYCYTFFFGGGGEDPMRKSLSLVYHGQILFCDPVLFTP